MNYFLFKRKQLNISRIIFFFPHYSFGGGERVHADILKIFKDQNPTCFITLPSKNDLLKNEFYTYAKVIELFPYLITKYNRYFAKLLAKKINQISNPIIFSSNNKFFYDLIPYLKTEVKLIDLTHTFHYEETEPFEKYSLKVANRLSKRIVLGQKTKSEFEKLYQENHIDRELINRIEIIPNKVDVPESLNKTYNKNLKILFVSRNSFEKRPEFFVEIAKRCLMQNKPYEFTLVGDFSKSDFFPKNIQVLGTIKEREVMHQLYSTHDILLITSAREGLPLVMLESMAFGMVPICTAVGEINSVINQTTNCGYLIHDKSIELWFDYWQNRNSQDWHLESYNLQHEEEQQTISDFTKQIDYLNHHRDELQAVGKNAHQLVKLNFSEEENTKAYKKCFFE